MSNIIGTAMIHNGDCLEILKSLEPCSLDSLVTDPPAGISFMGKEWDGDKGGRDHWVAWMTDVMRECLRVLKPGAHGLVWALPRTSHWTATALEDAGFEVRDVVTHLFGTGFPKSLDVSKAIDKAAGAIRPRVPGGQGGINTVLGARKPGEAISGEAKQWQGWGTALKPASEHWILVRKPCSEKTVAANVLKWGTGALNIDKSRVGTTDNLNGGTYSRNAKTQGKTQVPGNGISREFIQPQGRFPANLILDEEASMALDEQSGILGNAFRPNRDLEKLVRAGHITRQGTKKLAPTYEGSGGASRFFYVAKASKADKNAGLDESVSKAAGNRPNSSDMTGKFPDHDQRPRVGNFHPTVKSTSLMSYLINLVTPPDGVVLDPFMGSGSTGVAALSQDFRFLGIEKSEDYFGIASARIEASKSMSMPV